MIKKLNLPPQKVSYFTAQDKVKFTLTLAHVPSLTLIGENPPMLPHSKAKRVGTLLKPQG